MKDLKYLAAMRDNPTAYNDIEIGANGDIVTVEGTDRVKQDVMKMLLTESGLMPYPNYGTALPGIPKEAAFNPTLLNNVSSEVIAAVHYLIYIEESELTSEQIAEITTLEVTYENNAITINLALNTQDKQELTLGFAA